MNTNIPNINRIETIRVIVKINTSGSIKALQQQFQTIGAETIYTAKAADIIIINIPVDKVAELINNQNIKYIEFDNKAYLQGFESTRMAFQHVSPQQQTIPWGIVKIRAPDVWQSGNKGTNIKVAVIDTGIDYTHPDLKTNYKGGYNFINNTTDPRDDHGHGSWCCGCVAANSYNNTTGILGVAPEANIYALKVLDNNGSGNYSDIIAAIQWCIDNKIQVISMSFGGSSFSQALQDICDTAYNSNILLVAAAGNGGSDTDTILYPAKFASVMAVAATDINDLRANFSSVGPELDVSAPGVSIPGTVPNGTCNLCDPSGYKNLSGTSMATPHVSGEAALILIKHPDYSNKDIRKAIETYSLDLGDPGRDILFGYGRIDAKAAIDNSPLPTPVPNPPPNPTPPPNPVFKYTCLTDLGICIIDPNGEFPDLQSCQTACKQQAKFQVQALGNIGVLVQKSPTGTLTADQACTNACQIIKAL